MMIDFDEDQLKFIRFCKEHEDKIKRLELGGVFTFKMGSVIIRYDDEGVIRMIEKTSVTKY